MKTYKQWQKSSLDLDQFLEYPCEIDEKLYMYIAEIVAPNYCNGGIFQCGEPMYSDENGIGWYDTVSDVKGKYFYLGILPDFNNTPM